MKRKRNGSEMRSMRPGDMSFPLFPLQNPIAKSITLQSCDFLGGELFAKHRPNDSELNQMSEMVVLNKRRSLCHLGRKKIQTETWKQKSALVCSLNNEAKAAC